jgi:hypothetical protein
VCFQAVCKLLILERETGFEPATSSLGSWHSTTELLPPGVIQNFRYPNITASSARVQSRRWGWRGSITFLKVIHKDI